MKINDVYQNTMLSLTSQDEGFSFRKLSSLVVLGMVVYMVNITIE